MLVLSRKVGDKIVIGDNITVVVHRVQGNRVSLGIEAPADVRIVRGELKESEDSRKPRSSQTVGGQILPSTRPSVFHLSSLDPWHDFA